MRAAAGEVHRLFKGFGSQRIGLEGEGSNTWMLQDFGDIVVHLFTRESREAYDLENLWGDAPRVDWKTELEKSAKPAAKKSKPKSAEAEESSEAKPAKPRAPRKKKPKTDSE